MVTKNKLKLAVKTLDHKLATDQSKPNLSQMLAMIAHYCVTSWIILVNGLVLHQAGSLDSGYINGVRTCNIDNNFMWNKFVIASVNSAGKDRFPIISLQILV